MGGKRYCRLLTLGGYNDWRLPTLKELNKIATDDLSLSSNGYKYNINPLFVDNMPSLGGKYNVVIFHYYDSEKRRGTKYFYDLDDKNNKHGKIIKPRAPSSSLGYILCVRTMK